MKMIEFFIPRKLLLVFTAALNHTAPCAVKRAGIALIAPMTGNSRNRLAIEMRFFTLERNLCFCERQRSPSRKRQWLSGKLSAKTQGANHHIMGRACTKYSGDSHRFDDSSGDHRPHSRYFRRDHPSPPPVAQRHRDGPNSGNFRRARSRPMAKGIRSVCCASRDRRSPHPEFGITQRLFASTAIHRILDYVICDGTDMFLKLTQSKPDQMPSQSSKSAAGGQ